MASKDAPILTVNTAGGWAGTIALPATPAPSVLLSSPTPPQDGHIGPGLGHTIALRVEFPPYFKSNGVAPGTHPSESAQLLLCITPP
jgi:hypothetical protein